MGFKLRLFFGHERLAVEAVKRLDGAKLKARCRKGEGNGLARMLFNKQIDVVQFVSVKGVTNAKSSAFTKSPFSFWLTPRLKAIPRSPITLEVTMRRMALGILSGLWLLSASALVQAACLKTVNQLKAHSLKTRWQETTENDGKPLKIAIANGANGLVYSASKAGALWLTGNVSICLSGGATEITLKNTSATSNVPMFARMGLPSTQSATIVDNQMKLGGGGWSGTFVGY